jgi:hypothetical protein
MPRSRRSNELQHAAQLQDRFRKSALAQQFLLTVVLLHYSDYSLIYWV